MCIVQLPPDGNPLAVNKYIISYGWTGQTEVLVYLLTCQLHRMRFWYGNRPKYIRWLAKVGKGTGHGPKHGSIPRCRTKHDQVKTRKSGSRIDGLQASSIRHQHALNFNCENTPIKITYSFARSNFISHTGRQIYTLWETRQQLSWLGMGSLHRIVM